MWITHFGLKLLLGNNYTFFADLNWLRDTLLNSFEKQVFELNHGKQIAFPQSNFKNTYVHIAVTVGLQLAKKRFIT